MTSVVKVVAQSHDAVVRVLPTHGGRLTQWEQLSEETRKFAEHTVCAGNECEFIIHKNQSVVVMEGPEPFVLTILKGGGETFTFFPTDADREQCKKNHGQTLERLNERGGLTWDELLAVLHHRDWVRVPTEKAKERCEARRIA
jgi:hypothetical protein